MGVLHIFLALVTLQNIQNVLGVGCRSTETSTYLRSEGLRIMEVSKHTIPEVTLNACSKACTENHKGIQCESFEYDPRTQECSLHNSSGQPFGQSALAQADIARAFFQQICLPAENLCPTPYAFERYPQHVLMGNSLEVITVEGGLAECLTQCLDATSKYGIQCKSIVFYYTSNECILNRETRSTSPSLFGPVHESTLVDYFENNCYDVACSSSSGLHWLKSEEFNIGHEKDVIIESMSNDECKRLCIDNGVAGENFPCKAFVFSPSKEECHLSAETGLLQKKKSGFELSPISSGEYFEKMCLRSAFQCKEGSFEVVPNRQLQNATLRLIETSSVNTCLEACLNNRDTCSAATFNYELDECYLHSESQYTVPKQFITGRHVDYFDKICDYLPDLLNLVHDGSSSLPIQPTQVTHVSSADSFPTLATDTTPFSDLSHSVNSITPQFNNNIDDHPDSVDDDATVLPTRSSDELLPSQVPTRAPNDDNTFTPQKDDHRSIALNHDVLENQILENVGQSKEETLGIFSTNPERIKAHMTTECRLSGISLIVEFERPTSGAIFVQEAFTSCRVLFNNSETATLHIPFPNNDEANPKCPGAEIRPGFWSFLIAVQRNDLNSPSLMTSNDRVFNVTCDYSSVHEDALFIQSEDNSKLIDLTETPMSKIKMSILKDDVAISNVGLGDEVELRWTIKESEKKEENLGYFINECIAERIGGPSPEPEPLKLIFNGCPEENVRNRLMRYPVVRTSTGFSTKMKVFRFDGSRKVRIRCTVDVCVEMCPPVLCESESTDGATNEVQSFGRKKRQSMADLSNMMRRLRPEFGKPAETMKKQAKKAKTRKRSTTSGTITIFDRQAIPLSTELHDEQSESERLASSDPNAYCLSRSHLFSSIAIVVVLSIGQLFMILNCARRRCGHGSSAASQCSSGQTSYTTSSSVYQPSSLSSMSSANRELNSPNSFKGFSFQQNITSSQVCSPVIHEYEMPREPAPPPHRRRIEATLF